MRIIYTVIFMFSSFISNAQILQNDKQESWELGIAMQITLTCKWRSLDDKSKIEIRFKNYSKSIYSKSSQRDEMFEYYLDGLDSGKMVKYDQCANGVDKKKFVDKTYRALNGHFWQTKY